MENSASQTGKRMRENSFFGVKEIKTKGRKKENSRHWSRQRVGNQEIRGNFLERWPREKLASLLSS